MKSLAIIGSGIAGMACAYFLRDRYKISLYEKNNYVGGHTNTVYVREGGMNIPVDTGFMVYNDVTYPNLVRFFEQLGIRAMDTSMSFSVNNVPRSFEASFTTLRNFFPENRHWLEPSRYRLLAGLKKLFAVANDFIETEKRDTSITLKAFIAKHKINSLTVESFLLPMTAAIWSTPHGRMLDYPAGTLFRFLKNHGMLGFSDQFQWKTLKGGSQQYKNKILSVINDSIRVDCPAVSLKNIGDGVQITKQDGSSETFDLAIVATHADQALALLSNPHELEAKTLGSFHYNINPVILHSDDSVMPRSKRAWASWNYRYDSLETKKAGSTHYWMNSLQSVSKKQNYFVSVDYNGEIDERRIHWKSVYEHPRFDAAAIAAQAVLPQLNARGPVYFCGSYFRYGFHEDAFTSALNVIKILNEGKDPLS